MPLMIYCTAALTSFSDSITYITFIFRMAYTRLLQKLKTTKAITITNTLTQLKMRKMNNIWFIQVVLQFIVYSLMSRAFLDSTSVMHVKLCLALLINYANLN